jgi:2-keto-4-pentenoate hydratase
VNQQEHEEIAELLLEVYASHEPVEPLTAKFAGLTVDDAYEIQLLQVRHWLAGGAQVKGHKVGLTSGAMQRQLGVDQPDYGHLLDRMLWLEYEAIPVRLAGAGHRGGQDQPVVAAEQRRLHRRQRRDGVFITHTQTVCSLG